MLFFLSFLTQPSSIVLRTGQLKIPFVTRAAMPILSLTHTKTHRHTKFPAFLCFFLGWLNTQAVRQRGFQCASCTSKGDLYQKMNDVREIWESLSSNQSIWIQPTTGIIT